MRALEIGREARGRLDRCGTCAVHSVYRSTANLLLEERRLVCLTAEGVPMHPFALRLPLRDLRSLGLAPGMELCAASGSLRLPDARAVDYGDAPVRTLAIRELPRHPPHPAALRRMALLCRGQAERSAVGFLLRPGLRTGLSPWEPQIRRFAQSAVCGGAEADELSARLIGLGWGLTPTMDDFCVGLLAALHTRGAARRAAALGGRLARLAFSRSTLVSAQFLACAARGRFGAPVLAVLDSLQDAPGEALERSAAQLLATGHSSGLDTAAGLLVGLRAADARMEIGGIF